MQSLVDGAVCAPCSLLGWERRVEIRLLDIGLEAIDGLKRRIAVERDTVWPKPYNVSVLLMELVEVDMAMAGPCLVD